MKIKILTLFPKMFDALNESITGRAIAKNLLTLEIIDIRKYSADKHLKCDDAPFGGGSGMVMTPQPIFDAISAADPDKEYLRIYMSPKGQTLSTGISKNFAQSFDKILILCGHYEGVDQRVLDMCIDTEISIGDYVLTGGELPAMVLIDAVSRFIPGVLGSEESAHDESFSEGLLEYPQYTRPFDFMGEKVPDVLISGHHENINKWRRSQSRILTEKLRPDLLKKKED